MRKEINEETMSFICHYINNINNINILYHLYINNIHVTYLNV